MKRRTTPTNKLASKQASACLGGEEFYREEPPSITAAATTTSIQCKQSRLPNDLPSTNRRSDNAEGLRRLNVSHFWVNGLRSSSIQHTNRIKERCHCTVHHGPLHQRLHRLQLVVARLWQEPLFKTFSPRCGFPQEVAGKRKKKKKKNFLIIFDRLICCDSLHKFARKWKFTKVTV
jgi:hypothetical protein